MKAPSETIFIVDDDNDMRESLNFMFTGTGMITRMFASGNEFLAGYSADWRGCVLLDLRMPGLGGLQVHQRLREMKCKMPVIILTAHGDVPTAVELMKLGAFEFLTKPASREVLLARVGEAMEQNARRSEDSEELASINRRLDTLSERELQVVEGIVNGLASKQVAVKLGISYKTVSNHRDRILKKMNAENTASLVRMLGTAGRFTKQ